MIGIPAQKTWTPKLMGKLADYHPNRRSSFGNQRASKEHHRLFAGQTLDQRLKKVFAAEEVDLLVPN
jgi:hypothetical protein